MADQLGMTDASLFADHIKPAANFLAAHGPATGVERWEEQSGYSPSTIAAEIAGLVAAADLAQANGDPSSAAVWLGVADDMQRSVKGWTVTTNGSSAGHPYFIRLSKTGDPNAAISYNVGNGGPTLDQRDVIDAGFLELVRLGILAADDPDVAQSLPVVDATIKSDTPSGTGWHRYNGDGYGDGRPTGARGRRRGRGPATCGRSCPPSARSRRWRPATARGDGLALEHAPVRVRDRPDPRAGLGVAGGPGAPRTVPTRPWRRSASRTARPRDRPRRSRGRPPYVRLTADLGAGRLACRTTRHAT